MKFVFGNVLKHFDFETPDEMFNDIPKDTG